MWYYVWINTQHVIVIVIIIIVFFITGHIGIIVGLIPKFRRKKSILNDNKTIIGFTLTPALAWLGVV